MRQVIVAVSVLGAIAITAFAAEHRVELDGTGDFVQIQEAVDAAASGDTLLIGPGRWDDMFWYTSGVGGWTEQVIIAVSYKDLALIGSGIGETIIGPENPPPYGNPGPIAIAMTTDNRLCAQSMTIVNMRTGIYHWGRSSHIEDVHVLGCATGMASWATSGGYVRSCIFEACSELAIWAGSHGGGLDVRDCMFTGWAQGHISIQGVEEVRIENCDFHDGIVSIQLDGESCRGIVENCRVHSGYGPHISTVTQAQLTLNHSSFVGGNKQVQVSGYSSVSGQNNLFLGTDIEGGGYATIVGSLGILDIHESHILRGNSEYAVRLSSYSQDVLIQQRLENNYWGTASADTIAAWVWDEDDDPSMNVHTVVEPYYENPVRNEAKSMGSVKSMYR